ncbi:DUF1045 domain-containing protein [Roseovarius dicentrarchi]|uniref:DUF1045 domain-containing protein n=1 Tax=Roseovarius dicentrarchi TaxID=2250573 RepID=UPI000DEBB780|nr:DUF1045 domain-containing protein [Roseovarius dicentrarchi]
MPHPEFQRYAIYYTPAEGPLARFGAEWLGWDIRAGRVPAQRIRVPNLPIHIDELTQTPRRYGFHATIKPPFRLAAGRTEAELAAALTAFCAAMTPAHSDGLELAQLGRFLALVPQGDAEPLARLASDVVQSFDGFRAPLTEAELARHSTPRLGPAQVQNLHRWGYPHVMDCFRWHMTLTDKHPTAQVAKAHAALADRVTPLLPRPFTLNTLSLVGESRTGYFHLIQQTPLGG